MERFASVYLALGGEAEDALDNVVAVKMLTTLLSLIKFNKKEGDEKFQYVISNIFGEEEMRACNAVIDVSCVDMEDTWQAAKQPAQETEKEEIAPQPVPQPAPQPAPQPVAEEKPAMQTTAEVEVKITAERVEEPAVSVVEAPVAEAIIAEPVMEAPKAEPVVASIAEEKKAEPAKPAPAEPAKLAPAPAPAKPAPAPQGVAKMVAATEEADVSLDDLLEGLDFGGDN